MSARSHATDAHPGWKLSRACIQDIFSAKRAGVYDQGGLAAKLCASTLRQLRESQLAPHQETRMVSGRYLQMMDEKSKAPEIVVVLRGGLIQSVYSTNAYTSVYLADYDTLDPDDDEYEAQENAEERIARGDMYEVY